MTCPAGWLQFRDSCYQVMNPYGVGTYWLGAFLSCKFSYSSGLAIIASKDEMKFIESVALSLNRPLWIAMKADGKGLRWNSKENITNHYQIPPNAYCMLVKPTGNRVTWEFSSCSTGIGAYPLCQKAATPITLNNSEGLTTAAIVDSIGKDIFPTCPDNWLRYRNYCYYLETTTGNYLQGKNRCKNNLEAYPAIINDAEKEMIIRSILGIDDEVWIGLEGTSNNFTWYENLASINYTNLVAHACYPENSCNCTVLKKSNEFLSSWYVRDCNLNASILCQRSAIGYTSELIQNFSKFSELQTNCPTDWNINGVNCIQITFQKLRFYNAREFCSYHKSDLISLSSIDLEQVTQNLIEQKAVNQLVNITGVSFWIGLYKVNNTFQWLQDSTAVQENSKLEFRSTAGTSQLRCAVMEYMHLNGTWVWYTVDCVSHRAYLICRKTIDLESDTSTFPMVQSTTQVPVTTEDSETGAISFAIDAVIANTEDSSTTDISTNTIVTTPNISTTTTENSTTSNIFTTTSAVTAAVENSTTLNVSATTNAATATTENSITTKISITTSAATAAVEDSTTLSIPAATNTATATTENSTTTKISTTTSAATSAVEDSTTLSIPAATNTATATTENSTTTKISTTTSAATAALGDSTTPNISTTTNTATVTTENSTTKKISTTTNTTTATIEDSTTPTISTTTNAATVTTKDSKTVNISITTDAKTATIEDSPIVNVSTTKNGVIATIEDSTIANISVTTNVATTTTEDSTTSSFSTATNNAVTTNTVPITKRNPRTIEALTNIGTTTTTMLSTVSTLSTRVATNRNQTYDNIDEVVDNAGLELAGKLSLFANSNNSQVSYYYQKLGVWYILTSTNKKVVTAYIDINIEEEVSAVQESDTGHPLKVKVPTSIIDNKYEGQFQIAIGIYKSTQFQQRNRIQQPLKYAVSCQIRPIMKGTLKEPVVFFYEIKEGSNKQPSCAYWKKKQFHSIRGLIHANMAASMIISTTVFLLGIQWTNSPAICKSIAAILHFSLLATFLWMLIEGIATFKMSTHNLESRNSSISYLLLGWGITWVVGFLAYNHQTLILDYFFVILNSFQGVFIFYFHCYNYKGVKRYYARRFIHSAYSPRNQISKASNTDLMTRSKRRKSAWEG
ncbi:uncharacterized protein TRIADDRAFT_59352 [Trichoplax adhaerens]|uniref:C-type lectin domain-containing protein n=1 Tax=Trichoplax adhaerens TaxID=10228 RepID=B3S4U7_TRIAD|nr:predicted protein [Trichoplax adhaerens]EDV22152.1 predicted protein [Trichoplax adhaerens]|eukprot:XP_002115307.1 predicted protein [Trichoplax adhaerens]